MGVRVPYRAPTDRMKFLSPSRSAGQRNIFDRALRRLWLFPRKEATWSLRHFGRLHDRMKQKFPKRYWLLEKIPQYFYIIVDDFYVKPYHWFTYRFFNQYHELKLGLSPGYRDPDTRILHANFQVLVEYIEKDLATNFYYSERFKTRKNKKRLSITRFFPQPRKNIRRPEDGLKYLDNQISTNLPSPFRMGTSHTFGFTPAEVATEEKFLYLWWTRYRPQRLQYDSPLCREYKRLSNDDRMSDAYDNAESFYEDEDQEMLKRLVEIRRWMWF